MVISFNSNIENSKQYVKEIYEGIELRDDQLVTITKTDKLDIFKEIGKVKGRIRDIFWNFHGTQGKIHFPSEDIDHDSLNGFADISEKWRPDLFTSDARQVFITCYTSKGKKGDKFCSKFHGITLGHIGTTFSSPRITFGGESIKDSFQSEGLMRNSRRGKIHLPIFDHGVTVPVATYYWVSELIVDLLKGADSFNSEHTKDPKVKIYPRGIRAPYLEKKDD